MSTSTIGRKIVSEQEWLAAHREHLEKEKQFTRLRDELSRQRRELPWVKVEKEYVFDGPNGKETLAELFEGRSQLILYHFMFHPDGEEGCPGCSFTVDHVDGANQHLPQRDITYVAVARAPYAKLAQFQKRMGWRFKMVSSYGSDFNWDYHVSFTPEQVAAGCKDYNFGTGFRYPGQEMPGLDVFYKDESGDIYRTFGVYARGLDILLNTYNYIDLTPLGRHEEDLPFPMAWVRHHDKYPQPQHAAAANGCCAHEKSVV
ncbi:MAG TPA: thioredoxin family protein [Bryobacteraceae bacterium]|jgi:predicted dithiol-disulfide oxidoreductase (DUF899 family)|nr:thioredoxin family protein [Bryobacteraceae bacterium]